MNTKTDDFQIRQMQNIIMNILKEVVKICDRHGITYYLVEGTLLGAVRHNGFIPWDDDIDIAIPLEQIVSFVQYARQELPENFYIDMAFSEDRQSLSTPDLTRVYDNKFCIKDVSGSFTHLCIDILGIAGMPKNAIIRKIHYFMITGCRIGLRVSRKEIIRKNYWKNQIWYRKCFIWCLNHIDIGRFIPYNKQLNKLKKCLEKYPFSKSEFVMLYPSSYGKKEIMPKDYYGLGINKQFEDMILRIPMEPYKILTKLYGDYMTLPPEEARTGSHVAVLLEQENGNK